jgi:menaquinol-cytochrome c reductase iron-sulfur subunit
VPDTVHPDDNPAEGGSRRRFLGLTAVLGAAMGAMLGYPIGRIFAAPIFSSVRRTEKWVPVGPTSDFSEGRKTAQYSYEHQDGWYTALRTRNIVVAKRGDEWLAISTECTHAGCSVLWSQEQDRFLCPCHGAEFNPDGSVAKPPAPAPLTRLQTRVANGQLEVLEA